ncbi:MAG: hypothetical protein US96_C0010G0022 [Candidatus Woesebacteria bacterium GW2011_GWB1_38_5b]|uniref:Transglutaminase-like domain-containing protein n=1 Tax=Candidatus Woesebacteria bacterium GW2011_GWB1_38_5b TaxID=1618569 RepID=A0A0G0NEH1_9BACT|nr:MAG: hypothetical protein US96_C0010G0022 [Candidatus Woesebacteria bacterium GW2011_GWB1_38_5b]
MKNTINHYLRESEQIKITELVREHAEKALAIETNEGKNLHPNLQTALKVVKYILTKLHKIEGYHKPNSKDELDQQKKLKDSIFRKRKLQEILKDGYYPTCSDIGIVFRGLMVALGIPTAYVEAFHEDYLLGTSFRGHVLAKVNAGSKWYYIDPENNARRVLNSKKELYPLIVFKEGLDSWDIEIRSYNDMHKLKAENIKSLLTDYKSILQQIYSEKIKLVDKLLQDR